MPEREKEITVKLKWELDEAKLHFVNMGKVLTGSFILKDIYMIRENVDINKTKNLDVLANSLIIRESVGKEHIFQLLYKDKKYDEKGDIIDSVKYTCNLHNANEICDILNKIGFKECFRYEQECLEYNSDNKNILLQYVPELGLFIELEDNTKSVDELINDLNSLEIAYYDDNYFVKKASLMLDVIKKQGGQKYDGK